jgi:hypothetical protein
MEEDDFTPEKFAHTLNTLGTWQSMLDQMMKQEIYTSPNCQYYEQFAGKLMDLQVSLLALNTIYSYLYEKYKETHQNG